MLAFLCLACDPGIVEDLCRRGAIESAVKLLWDNFVENQVYRRTWRERQFLYMHSYYVSQHLSTRSDSRAPRVPDLFRVSPRPIHARLRLRLDGLGIVGSSIVPHLSLPHDNVLLPCTSNTTCSCFRGSHNWHAIFLVLYQTTRILLLLRLPVLAGES